MLKIQRSSDSGVVLEMSGRIGIGDVPELWRLLSLEAAGENITFDLKDVTLIDRDAVTFLAQCQANGIKLEDCPAYIRGWLDCRKKQPARALNGAGPRVGPMAVTGELQWA